MTRKYKSLGLPLINHLFKIFLHFILLELLNNLLKCDCSTPQYHCCKEFGHVGPLEYLNAFHTTARVNSPGLDRGLKGLSVCLDIGLTILAFNTHYASKYQIVFVKSDVLGLFWCELPVTTQM